MRKEALRLVYRKTSFHLDGMDEFVKFAISIGKTGRQNVESISFAWESKSDMESVADEDLSSEHIYMRLPNLHSIRCVQLLRNFKRLKCLRLHFDDDLLSTLSSDDFKNDPGLRNLHLLDRIDKVDIPGEPADRHESGRWKRGIVSGFGLCQLHPRTNRLEKNTCPTDFFSSTIMSQAISEEQTRDNASPAVDDGIDPAASIKYWNSVPATANGMLAALGGYPWYSRIDLRGSKSFLAKARRLVPACTTEGKLSTGVDCGAGVGRVTEGFLSQVCETVDAVEPVEKFTQTLHEGTLKASGVVDVIYTVGIENWHPEKKYDLIWTQFCVGHLKDWQLIEYVRRCRDALTETGILVFKENLSTDPNGHDMYDGLDSSVTRTDAKFRDIFRDAGINVIVSELQTGFPKTFKLLPVRSYALRPKV